MSISFVCILIGRTIQLIDRDTSAQGHVKIGMPANALDSRNPHQFTYSSRSPKRNTPPSLKNEEHRTDYR